MLPRRLILTLTTATRSQVFVVHGDVLALSSDALLVPTRNLNNRKWFPAGPPEGATQPERDAFKPDRRVFRVEGGAAERGRATWLGHLDGRFAPPDRRRDCDDAPELSWFLEAASQFLSCAHADLLARGKVPRCQRAKHVLAMPVVGTGKGGARGSSGEIITALLTLLQEFVVSHDVDVALVVKNDRMFSAAQAHRRLLSRGWEEKLGARLHAAAAELAQLAASERLCLFLGAGVSVGAGLPEWRQLLETLARRPEVPLDPDEVRQLSLLGLPDQAAVVSSRLGGAEAAAAAIAAAEEASTRASTAEGGVTGGGAVLGGGDAVPDLDWTRRAPMSAEEPSRLVNALLMSLDGDHRLAGARPSGGARRR